MFVLETPDGLLTVKKLARNPPMRQHRIRRKSSAPGATKAGIILKRDDAPTSNYYGPSSTQHETLVKRVHKMSAGKIGS